MQFNQIIAQQEVKQKLKELVQNNRLPHALLFLSREGSGALPLAIAFAQYILCEKVDPASKDQAIQDLFEASPSDIANHFQEDSCGTCGSCVKVSQLIHPDLHFSYPVLKKDSNHERVLSTDYMAEWRSFIKQYSYYNVSDWINYLKENAKSKIDAPINKQGNITSAECEDISNKLSLKAFESSYKILIMWMPEFLSNSGNKLLKLIEEPPADTLLIFVAEDVSAILPTILSRTQLIKIPSLSVKEVEQALIKNNGATEEQALRIASISEGNFREASLLLNNVEEDWQEEIRKWLNIILQYNVNNQLKWIDDISKIGREKQKLFLRYFIHLLEQAIRVRYLEPEDITSIPEKEIDFSLRLIKMCGMDAQEAIIQELDKAIYYIERNAHAKLLFHSLTIRIFHIIKDNSLVLIN